MLRLRRPFISRYSRLKVIRNYTHIYLIKRGGTIVRRRQRQDKHRQLTKRAKRKIKNSKNGIQDKLEKINPTKGSGVPVAPTFFCPAVVQSEGLAMHSTSSTQSLGISVEKATKPALVCTRAGGRGGHPQRSRPSHSSSAVHRSSAAAQQRSNAASRTEVRKTRSALLPLQIGSSYYCMQRLAQVSFGNSSCTVGSAGGTSHLLCR